MGFKGFLNATNSGQLLFSLKNIPKDIKIPLIHLLNKIIYGLHITTACTPICSNKVLKPGIYEPRHQDFKRFQAHMATKTLLMSNK